jgi:hypothetical protein
VGAASPIAGRLPDLRWLYSFDVLIPFASFGQKDFWSPTNTGGLAATASYYYRPAHMLLGWLFTTIFVGAVTGLIKRE